MKQITTQLIFCIVLFLGMMCFYKEGFDTTVNAYPTMTDYESYIPGITRQIPILRQTYQDSVVQPQNEINTNYEIVSLYPILDSKYTDTIITTCIDKDYFPQSGITDPSAYYRVCRESMAD